MPPCGLVSVTDEFARCVRGVEKGEGGSGGNEVGEERRELFVCVRRSVFVDANGINPWLA